ncbi:MAG: hypothetical protein NZL85_04370, partial [Fimbriimonadales bacterium]|nr:hypothetical protein [Fimbriimonadales bacterium]
MRRLTLQPSRSLPILGKMPSLQWLAPLGQKGRKPSLQWSVPLGQKGRMPKPRLALLLAVKQLQR